MTAPQIHRHTITDGSHADLKKIMIRLPFETSAALTSSAAAKGQSVSLYLARMIEERVRDHAE